MALMGRNCSVKLNSNTVEDLYNWKIDLTSNPIEQAVFGDIWGKTHGLGITKWSGGFDGIYSEDDTTGQVAFQNAQISGTLCSGVQFYMDTATTYYTGDLYITSHNLSADPEDVVRVTYTFNGTGPLVLTTV